jgi:hypothetical protein
MAAAPIALCILLRNPKPVFQTKLRYRTGRRSYESTEDHSTQARQRVRLSVRRTQLDNCLAGAYVQNWPKNASRADRTSGYDGDHAEESTIV